MSHVCIGGAACENTYGKVDKEWKRLPLASVDHRRNSEHEYVGQYFLCIFSSTPRNLTTRLRHLKFIQIWNSTTLHKYKMRFGLLLSRFSLSPHCFFNVGFKCNAEKKTSIFFCIRKPDKQKENATMPEWCWISVLKNVCGIRLRIHECNDDSLQWLLIWSTQ